MSPSIVHRSINEGASSTDEIINVVFIVAVFVLSILILAVSVMHCLLRQRQRTEAMAARRLNQILAAQGITSAEGHSLIEVQLIAPSQLTKSSGCPFCPACGSKIVFGGDKDAEKGISLWIISTPLRSPTQSFYDDAL
ncbi:hypothetical protein CPB83DRAFT_890384 [Crepidotus variabilis]|uniref:Uncharacterized protein n=1 Tax=Crepidotus variabilis TaxID=179855 RepID=A0A9P6EP14_9AGAR|nr:hypothetical protein CPB83DRAFT_890384 [Crepidotus variabilis]